MLNKHKNNFKLRKGIEMYCLDFEEKLIVKEFAERNCYLSKDEEKLDSLKGSLDIELKNFVEKLLRETTCHYLEEEKNIKVFKEVKSHCIGKAIVVLKNDGKTILEIISLKNYNFGIDDYKKFVKEMNQEYMECFGKEEEEKKKLDILIDEFKNLGKWKKIEKGKILEEIDSILSQDKELGNKGHMWKKLGISNSDKSMFCKRYNLFKEFQENGNFSEDKEWIEVIDRMTDLKLKEITKEGLSVEEKENMILSLNIK